MSITVAIPCYDEAEGIPQLCAGLTPVLRSLANTEPTDLLLVDDGSRDGTADLLEAHRAWPVEARVVRHERNRGLGAAVRTCFREASGRKIVVCDADGTYDFGSIPHLLARMTPDVAIVTASPYHPDGSIEGVPLYRLALSRGASTLYRLLVDRSIHTYTAMFRAYRAEIVKRTPFDSDDYLAVTEILVNAMRAGHRIAEMPATLRVRQFGQSKARSWRITRTHLAFMWRIARAPGTEALSTQLP